MGDAIHEDRIRARLIHASPAEFCVFGHDPLISPVDLLYKSWRPGPFTTDDHTDFEHISPLQLIPA
jgi:hypothetical protein